MSLFSYLMSEEQLKIYNEKMNLGMADKIFFMQLIDGYDVLVDYGCADGNLIKASLVFNPDALHIGYDSSEQMLRLAGKNVESDHAIFTNDWNEVLELIKDKKRSLLTVNSLIHEIYSYCDDCGKSVFWNQIFSSGFTYISIRDMMMKTRDYNKKLNKNTLKDTLNVLSASEHGEEKINSFENVHGKIITRGQLIHLLMKWDYWNNWEREVNEDYLGFKVEDLLEKLKLFLPERNYKMNYFETFTLKYLHDRAKSTANINIDVSTHVKVFLSNSTV